MRGMCEIGKIRKFKKYVVKPDDISKLQVILYFLLCSSASSQYLPRSHFPACFEIEVTILCLR